MTHAQRIIKVAAVQMAPVLNDAMGTLHKVLKAIDDAAALGVQLIVFPETFVPYYPYFTEAVSQRARQHGMVVVLGVNERDHGSIYNAQLIFDETGALRLKRRKLTPTFHERMVWGQGDGSGLKVVDTAVGRVGALACWEHYNPLARYALMAQHEEIHCAQFPGSLVGPIFADQMEVTIRHHALEAGCFVINSTGWLTEEQVASITPDAGLQKALRGGCCTAIVSPEGAHVVPPLKEGEGLLIADLDMSLVTKRKRMMDSVGHYARPELLSLNLDDRATAPVHAMSAGLASLAAVAEGSAGPESPFPSASAATSLSSPALSRVA
jgi:nitrilase